VFLDAVESSHKAYDWLIENGIPAEDARMVAPEGEMTEFVMTMNARELRHFFSLRCCNRAQWEIRKLARRMLAECSAVAPELFKDAGPGCLRGACPEGKRSCGKPYTKGEDKHDA
ncbi:MAG: FAD-dependent thymidylate synthase, partial [Clostridiales bacterium]|nr:FAD-dependent thymidylate synthase [Clostridiales bacterium]